MIQGIFYFFGDSMFPVHIGIETSHYIIEKNYEGFYENSLRGKKHGVLWTRLPPGKSNIKLFEHNTTIWAYPSTDFKYIVAVYNGYHTKKFPTPSNAVVYNEDGSIHKIITTPLLKTPDKEGIYQKGYMFNGVGWTINKNNEISVYINILESDNPYVSWQEQRSFNPETGEIGELLNRSLL